MSRRRWAALAAVSLVVLALVATAAASWHFSSAVLVPDHSPWEQKTSVEALPPGRIVLERSEETERPGVYGLEWQGGRAIAGAIVAEGEDTVTRRLRAVDGYLAPGMKVAIDSDVFAGSPTAAFGLPSRKVQIPGDELGPMSAWLVPAAGGEVWAIVVHGINGTPQTGLRIVPTLHRAGLPTLLIDYREDLGAPASPDGFHHMGQTEWNDLAAAVDYALDRDATRVVLIGYSMGGAIVTQFMEHSPRIHRVAGIVLDVVEAATARVHVLARRTDALSTPAWSPDGRSLAFADAGGHLETISSDGRVRRVLTRGISSDANPAWRP